MSYLTVDEFKEYRNIADSDFDSLILTFIESAQAFIERETGEKFEGSAADRKFDSSADVEGSVLWTYSAGPLASITSITNGNGDSVASGEYVTEPRNAVAMGKPIWGIRLKTNSSVWWRSASGVPEDAITVNGVWAYSATPPADVKQAMRVLVNYYYSEKDSGLFDVTAFPDSGVIQVPSGVAKSAMRILRNYLVGT